MPWKFFDLKMCIILYIDIQPPWSRTVCWSCLFSGIIGAGGCGRGLTGNNNTTGVTQCLHLVMERHLTLTGGFFNINIAVMVMLFCILFSKSFTARSHFWTLYCLILVECSSIGCENVLKHMQPFNAHQPQIEFDQYYNFFSAIYRIFPEIHYYAKYPSEG